jgi:hypothetical protein
MEGLMLSIHSPREAVDFKEDKMRGISLKFRLLAFTAILLASAFLLFRFATTRYGRTSPDDTRALNPYAEKIGNLPITFVQNEGQVDQSVVFYTEAPGSSVYFTPTGHAFSLVNGKGENAVAYNVSVELIGASPEQLQGVDRSAAVVNLFKGSRENWKTDIPTFKSINYSKSWPGIDIAYQGKGSGLESIYSIAPQADPNLIRMRYSGQEGLHLDADGNLVYVTSAGDVTESAPNAWQYTDGEKVSVSAKFKLYEDNVVGFELGDYNSDVPLIIDPVFQYVSYIGGNALDRPVDVAVDSAGYIYIVGETASSQTTFPVAVGPDLTYNGGSYDGFVLKLNPAGTALIYSGYIGGADFDSIDGVAVDGSGYVYMIGSTGSSEATFPVNAGPDLTFNSSPPPTGSPTPLDAFVAKLNPSGTSLVYCGYIGGTKTDIGTGISIDSSGNAYVVGTTFSSQSENFPVIVGPDLTFNDTSQMVGDAFVGKVNQSGTGLVYLGYIGGDNIDSGVGIGVDSSGNAYIGGRTWSTEATFPVSNGPDLTYNGAGDAFIAKVNPSGTSLLFAGYIGGSQGDDALDFALDNYGNGYLTGRTRSPDAPTPPPPGSPTPVPFPVLIGPDLTFNQPNGQFDGTFDGWVAKVSSTGNLVYAGYIGGSANEYAERITVDSVGSAYVTGETVSYQDTFPVKIGPDLTYNGILYDGFIAKVSPSGDSLVYCSYIGGGGPGGGSDYAGPTAVDSTGVAYVTGTTDSNESTFPDGSGIGNPPRFPGLDQTFNGGGDAFLVKISPLAASTYFDFDLDGKADSAVFRPSNATWYELNSSNGTTTNLQWGQSNDKIAPADYDGDGKVDHAIFRKGDWYIFQSSNGQSRYEQYGQAGDLPRPGDFDGDGKADLAVFRPINGTWYYKKSSDGSLNAIQFGASGDNPMIGDFDGDKKTDFALFRPSNSYWYIYRSSNGQSSADWFGQTGDIPLNGDFNGDARSDLAVFRPSDKTWYIARPTGIPSQNFDAIPFGLSTDTPVPANYDGDAKTDIAVFRSGAWYVLSSLTGATLSTSFGLSSDQPVEAAYLP